MRIWQDVGPGRRKRRAEAVTAKREGGLAEPVPNSRSHVRGSLRHISWRGICMLGNLIAGAAMPILTIRHVTTYHYRQPVAFGEHRMMLRPRDDGDQIVLDSELDITPAPSQLSWECDSHGNHVATAIFARR